MLVVFSLKGLNSRLLQDNMCWCRRCMLRLGIFNNSVRKFVWALAGLICSNRELRSWCWCKLVLTVSAEAIQSFTLSGVFGPAKIVLF